MKPEDKAIMCRLIRDHEDLVGSSRVAMLSLEAFIESIRQLKCSADEVADLYAELAGGIKTTEPKVIPLIHLIEEFEAEMEGQMDGSLEEIRERAISILIRKRDDLKDRVGKVMEHGLNCISAGDVILLHTASLDVTNMFVLAKGVLQIDFSTIVLKQDPVKTRKLIRRLNEGAVEMAVVPEYNLSHYLSRATKIFVGSLSVTPDMQFVAAIGTANIVSLCHLNKIPVYLFANTLKFAHKPGTEQQIHTKVESHAADECTYTLTTHSHDLVDMALVDYLVTETGVYPRDRIEACIQGSACVEA
jgi:translation initiation factor 2B subunit (eIF-2B alpha/beta/delta family)